MAIIQKLVYEQKMEKFHQSQLIFFVFRLAFMLQISCGVGGSKESEGSTGLVKQVL